MLTKKQRDLLLFIQARVSGGGIAPSFDEMKDALSLKSKSGIHRLITALVERGYLQRLPNRARALDVVKLPEGVFPSLPSRAVPAERRDEGGGVTDLPLLGKIAAGTPIEAIQQEGEAVIVPSSLLGSGEHYALRVEGDSMINAGIHDADLVIIRRTNSAPDGRIVVALVDGQEATLKRLYRREGKVVLEAENEAYKPRILTPDRVQIQGELCSLLRTYHTNRKVN